MHTPEEETKPAETPVQGFGPVTPETADLPVTQQVDIAQTPRTSETPPDADPAGDWEKNDEPEQVGGEITDGEAG